MSLIAGTRIGAYEILDTLGAGGMGEVYRARDTHLGRDVAIKVLPEAFAHDADRLARFEREARTLAALNHPNIAAVYGLEKSPAGTGPAVAFAAAAASAPREAGHYILALVMELVDGPTLAERMAQGAIPLDEALPLAKQIAEALEGAHEHGIIHRDLKPANIKVRLDGTVKVLDFGLAKAMEPVGAETSSASLSPTITTPAMTLAGMILGTAAYMSPEQASGKAVGKRADIWAFGVVLWEMLTGNRLFEGETISHTLAFVLTKEPDWRTLPAATPEPIRRVLRRCLEKSPRHRLADIADARFELNEAAQSAGASGVTVAAKAEERLAVSTRRTVLDRAIGFVTGTALTFLVGYGWFAFSPKPSIQPVRFTIGPSGSQSIQISNFDRDVVISPDGRHILYVSTEGGRRQLMARPIDQLAAVPLHEINSAAIAVSLFVSPDSQWVGFFEGNELKKVSMSGGPAIPLCKFDGNPRGASWGLDNTIVFATSAPGLRRVSSAGGDPQVLTKIDAKAGETGHFYPSLLPDGRSALFVITSADANRDSLAVADLLTGQYKVLIRGGTQAKYVASGHLVYASAGTLFAVAFDPNRREVSGEAIPVLNRLMTVPNGAANFDVSSNGTMVFITGAANQTAMRSLVWVNRQGREEPIPAPPRAYVAPRLSPDGMRIAVDSRDQQEDILVWDLARRTLTTLTRSPQLDQRPVWTPNGERIVFNSGFRNIFWQSADGTGVAETLAENLRDLQGVPSVVSSITPDGTQVLVDGDAPGGGGTIGALPLKANAGETRSLKTVIRGVVNLRNAEVSPDGKWLAYQSNESNQPQIYVRPFPDVEGGQWQISMTGGIRPVWARDRRELELFYIDPSDALMSVSVQGAGASLLTGNPTKVFDASRYLVRSGFNARTYDVSGDGQRFLMVKDNAVGESGSSGGPIAINVVMNWLEELKQRMLIH